MSSGVHDLGGREGVGAINPTPAEPVWKAEWEKHAHALFPLAFRAGFFGLDQFRFGMEQMDPDEYLTSPYYEHWVHAVVHHGVRPARSTPTSSTRARSTTSTTPTRRCPRAGRRGRAGRVHRGHLPVGAPPGATPARPAKFSVGDRVTVIADAPRATPAGRATSAARPASSSWPTAR